MYGWSWKPLRAAVQPWAAASSSCGIYWACWSRRGFLWDGFLLVDSLRRRRGLFGLLFLCGFGLGSQGRLLGRNTLGIISSLLARSFLGFAGLRFGRRWLW